jgi:syntaxin 5
MAEDRTSEFLSLAHSMPAAPRTAETATSTLSVNGGKYNRDSPSYAQLKDFHVTAGGISRDIASTSQLLADLAQMVKQKSLFQDDTRKVNDLVVRIKSSIESLNGRLDEAGRQIAQQKRALGSNSQAGQEASNVVGQLKEEFSEAAAGFKKVLQQRTDVLKETDDRKRQIYGQTSDDDMAIPVLNLENKPHVYSDNSSMALGGFPTLDLTSGMTAGESTSSGSQLPRPRKSTSSDIFWWILPSNNLSLFMFWFV